MSDGIPGSGGFITFPGGQFVVDPASQVTVPGPGARTSFGMSYDLGYHRWLPVPWDWITPDGSKYVYATPTTVVVVSVVTGAIIREFGKTIPLFGVCLGHQCIGHTFGAKVVVNYRMMHGKTSLIKHNGKDLFAAMPNPFAATRYHSLVIQRNTLPDFLEITAETDEGEIMGIRHLEYPIHGVQFHPESILTESGRTIMKNFLTFK